MNKITISEELKLEILQNLSDVAKTLGKDPQHLFNKIFSDNRKFPYFMDNIFKCVIDTSGEKLTKHIAFSEEAVANGIPIKVSQKRYTFPPPADVLSLIHI